MLDKMMYYSEVRLRFFSLVYGHSLGGKVQANNYKCRKLCEFSNSKNYDLKH